MSSVIVNFREMKKYILIAQFLIYAICSSAQEFPNFDFSDVCGGGVTASGFIDPFTPPTSSTFCLYPWSSSHGTPQLESATATIYLYAGKDLEDMNSPGDGGSEGVLYEYTFIEGRKYHFQADADLCGVGPDNIDRVRIALVNGTSLPPGPDNSYEVPNWDRQTLWTVEDFDDAASIDICFVPEEEYTHLLIYAWSDEVDPSGNEIENCLTLGNLSLACCEESKIITTTEQLKYPGWTETFHIPLPLVCSVSGDILVDPSVGDILINEGENVTLTAGNEIVLLADPNSNFELLVDTDNGAELHLIIGDCDCSSPGSGNDICANYIPAGTPPGQNVGGFEYIQLPNLFSPGGGGPGPGDNYFTVYYGGYIMPYNAYKAIFRVFQPNGGLAYEQIVEDRCGLPDGILFWDGCTGSSPAASTTYTWTLYLENCHNDILLSGSVHLVNAASQEFCDNFKPDDDTRLYIGGGSGESTLEVDMACELKVFPNPVLNESVVIAYQANMKGKIDLFIQDVNGKTIKEVVSNKEVGKGVQEEITLDLSSLPKGIYLCTLQTDQTIISEKIIKI